MMGTALASRIAALGVYALCIAEISGSNAADLLRRGIKPPIGSGHPVEVFTACGVGAFQHLANTMMPAHVKMNVVLEFRPPPRLEPVASWENDSGDRRVVTMYSPDTGLFYTACIGTNDMARPLESHNIIDARKAHKILVRMVQAGQL